MDLKDFFFHDLGSFYFVYPFPLSHAMVPNNPITGWNLSDPNGNWESVMSRPHFLFFSFTFAEPCIDLEKSGFIGFFLTSRFLISFFCVLMRISSTTVQCNIEGPRALFWRDQELQPHHSSDFLLLISLTMALFLLRCNSEIFTAC